MTFDEWWEANEKDYSADACHMSEYHMAATVWNAALASRPEAQPLNWVRVDYGPPSDAPAWPGETIFFVDKHRTRWRLELPQLPLAMNSGGNK